MACFWTEPNPLLSLKHHPVASRFTITEPQDIDVDAACHFLLESLQHWLLGRS